MIPAGLGASVAALLHHTLLRRNQIAGFRGLNGVQERSAQAVRRQLRVGLSVPFLLVAAVLIGMLPLVVRRVGDTDYWWHLVTAQWILDHRALPAHDLYTYTVSDHVWTDHEWLSELLLYGLNRLGGELAVSIGIGLLTWAGFLLILARIHVRPHQFIATAGALAIGVLAGEGVWGPRPQMITFFFICLLLYWLETFLAGRSRALYAMPLVVVIWANLHAGFTIAFLFLGVMAAVEAGGWVLDPTNRAALDRSLRIAAVGVASGLAGLVNPHGLSLYTYAWQTETSAVQQSFIREWHSPNFHDLDTRGFEAMFIALLIGCAFRWTRPRAWDVAVSAVALLLALQSIRNIPIFVAAATPVLAWLWAPAALALGQRWYRQVGRLTKRSRDLESLTLLGVGVVSLGALVALQSALSHQHASTVANYPSEAADYLDAHPQLGTRMFSDYGWGGYMVDRFYPRQNRKVFAFGEASLMGDTLMQNYADIVDLNGDWLSLLKQYNVDYVVFEPGTPLSSALALLPNWRLVHSDPLANIYVRESP
jgi:hypothetical protein